MLLISTLTGDAKLDQNTIAMLNELANRLDGSAEEEAPNPAQVQLEHTIDQVASARARLWSHEEDGPETLNILLTSYHLIPRTIHDACLGWHPHICLANSDGGKKQMVERIVVPWFDGDRLCSVRLLDLSNPLCGVEVFRDEPRIYPSRKAIRVGQPVIVTASEVDALFLAQELGDMASVVCFGDPSVPVTSKCWSPLLVSTACWLAFTQKEAGKEAAAQWPKMARWAGYPAGCSSWFEARNVGVSIRGWWSDRLAKTI